MPLLDNYTPEQLNQMVDDFLGESKADTGKAFIHPNERSIDEKMLMLAPQLKTNKTGKIVHESMEKVKKQNSETTMQKNLCAKMREAYPGILFFSDFAAGLHLPAWVADARAAQASDEKWLDLFIPYPKGGYFGLVFELKTESGTCYRKDGKTLLKTAHIDAQWKSIQTLKQMGYFADFSVGEDHTWQRIQKYMALPMTIRK